MAAELRQGLLAKSAATQSSKTSKRIHRRLWRGIKFNHERGEEHLAEYHGFWHDKLVFVLFNEHPSGRILVSVGFDKDGNEDGYAEEFPLKHDTHFDDALRRITSAVKARIEVFEDDGL